MARSLIRLLGLGALGVALPASAGPVVHEFFATDAEEDVATHATTLSGTLPAALDTQSGIVQAPDVSANAPTQASTGEIYGGASSAVGDGARYQPDGDTRQPGALAYDDPFSPAIPPFKRMFAFDSVNENFELVVNNRALTRVPIEGTAHQDDDQFYGDLQVELLDKQPARLPSVGPGARALAVQSVPAVPFELLHDSADNWFLRSSATQRVRLTFHLAIPRAVFGSAFQDVSVEELNVRLPPLPPQVVEEGRAVGAELELDPTARPRKVVERLIRHFRDFAPSEEVTTSEGAELYREIAVSQRGVCRHRAYAFMITALAHGVPTRFVHNEAHAWVEVFDSHVWHRIDLGGAALEMSMHTTGPRHVSPPDPFEWPSGADSAEELTYRASETGPGASGARGSSGDVAPGDGAAQAAPAAPGPSASTPSTTQIIIDSPDAESSRGGRVLVSGAMQGEGSACAQARVDIALVDGNGGRYPVGTLVTDEGGHFQGNLVIPFSAGVGDYHLVASTPGSLTCTAGTSDEPQR